MSQPSVLAQERLAALGHSVPGFGNKVISVLT